MRIAREPEQLADVTIQPVIFVLLFTYVFGSAIHLGGGGGYHQYLVSGMFGMTMAGSAPGTAVGLTTDMASGLIDRFRSLPISRAAVLAGRTVADLVTQVLGIVVLAATGLAIGWRIHNGIGDALAAAGLSLLFAFAMTWAGACAGMVLRSPESAQALGFILFLPLSFVSNAFVPTAGMPSWLRDFANWNPMSAVAATCRDLFGGANPAARRACGRCSTRNWPWSCGPPSCWPSSPRWPWPCTGARWCADRPSRRLASDGGAAGSGGRGRGSGPARPVPRHRR